ncbi:hypothetical protein FRC17_004014 [Serendipita sp. 399]|nr:hypothetical protein FRC17_004014 [Serendipita sp. 399]
MVPSSTDHPLPVLESDPPTVPFADDDPLIQALTCFHWESNPGGDVDTFISDSFEYPFQPRMCSPDFFESVNRWMETDNQLLASASLARVDSHPALPNYDLLGDIPRTPLTLDLVQSICSPPFSSPFIPAYPSSAALSILWSTNMLQYPQYILDICSPTTAPETNPPGMGMTLASVPFSTETYANTNDFNLDFDFGPSFDYGSGLTSSSPNSSSFICSGEGGGVVSQVRGFRSLSSFCCAAVACASSVRSPASSLSPPSPAASSVFSPSSTGLAPVSVSVPVSEAAGSCFDEIVGSGFDDLDETPPPPKQPSIFLAPRRRGDTVNSGI